MQASQSLAVTLNGRGPVTLNQTNYVTTGGEASIYRVGDTIVKIYTDPKKMVKDRMSDKIAHLAQIKHRFIVSPIDLALDKSRNAIGYYMPFVGNTEPLSRAFTTDFRTRTKFTDNDAIDLVHNMRETVTIGHHHGCILADANELNWLLFRAPEAEPRLVDVDSWQVGNRWPARAIMMSIYDWHTTGFTEASDWFAWAVVTFQIFTGIHPYKGRLDGYGWNDFEKRMKDNASVFSPNVHLNAAVRDFSCIPTGLLDWYQATFQHGERTLPPSPRDTKRVATAARTLRQTVTTSATLVFEKIMDGGNNPFIRVYPSGLAMRQDGRLTELRTKRAFGDIGAFTPDAEVIQTNSGWLVGEKNLFVHITLTDTMPLTTTMAISRLVRSGNRMFAVTDRGLSELMLHDMGAKPLITFSRTWPIMPNATEWFEGLGVQNSLGAKYLILPCDADKVNFVRVRELDNVTVVNAKAGPRFASVVALDDTGNYKKIEFTFDEKYQKYTIWTGDTDTADLNLAILPNGVCATIVEDTKLTIFVPASKADRKVKDKTISTDMRLATWQDKVIYIKGGDIWWVHLK